MSKRRHILTLAVAAALAGTLGTNAMAAPQSSAQYVQNSISPAQAKSIAQARVKGGRAVDIKRKGNQYRVRVMAPNKKVVDVYIDANTGRVTKVK